MSTPPDRAASAQSGLATGGLDWRTLSPQRVRTLDKTLLEDRACPLCGCQSHRTFLTLDDFQFYTDDPSRSNRVAVRQVECRRCGCLHMNPCYSRSGFQKLFARSGASYGAPMWKYRRRADWLMQTLELDAGMTVMDLGCHDGRLLSLLPPELDRVGLDVDATVLARAGSAHPGIRFVRGDLDAADNTGSAQVVTLFHVLEHLRDPVGTLRRLHETSPPGTRLVVEVPVLGAARDADINGFFSVHHLTHFTEHHLIECVEAAGWRVTCLAREDAYNAVRLVAQTCGPRQPRQGNGPGQAALYNYLAHYHAALAQVALRLESLESHRVAIWGAGCHTELLYQLTGLFRPERAFVLTDSDESKWGERWRDIIIYPPDMLRYADWAETALVVSSYGGQDAIAATAKSLGVPDSSVVLLYASGEQNG